MIPAGEALRFAQDIVSTEKATILDHGPYHYCRGLSILWLHWGGKIKEITDVRDETDLKGLKITT